MIKTENAYKFLQQVHGSPAYWQKMLYETLAMLRCKGIPTWFLTLSAAEYHWPEMIKSIASQFGECLQDSDVNNMTWEEKTLYLRHNPVTAVCMFEHCINALFHCYLQSSAHPLRQITDYVIKIEFQAHGSPHAHILLWVANAPLIDKNHDADVTGFIDKYVTGQIPREESDEQKIVSQLETHVHSNYCK